MKRLNRRKNPSTMNSGSELLTSVSAPVRTTYVPANEADQLSSTTNLISAAVVEEPLVLEMSLWSWGLSAALIVSSGLATLVASPVIAAYQLLSPSAKSSGS